jgi:hypothetical protein
MQRLEGVLSAMSARARVLAEPLLGRGEATLDGDDLVVAWPGGEVLRALTAQRALPSDAPASLRSLFAACGGLEVGEPGTADQLVLHDGTTGTLATIGADAWNRRFPFACDDIRWAPIDVGLQAFYVVDPRDGALWFRDEGTLERVRDTRDVVELYLRELQLRFGEGDRGDWLTCEDA